MVLQWELIWPAARPANDTCACAFVHETNFMPGKYMWYNSIAFLQRSLFKLSKKKAGSPDRGEITWPWEGSFAISKLQVLLQPKWLFETLRRLVSAEGVCVTSHGGSYEWGMALERLWFDIFDPHVIKQMHISVNACLRSPLHA